MHVITTYGGGELFFLVFNGIAALFKTDHTGLVMSLIRVGLTVGSVYVVVLMLFRHQLEEGLKWFLWVIVATNLIFLPKTRIHIHDPLNNYHRDVDHVPLALGAFASLVSQVGKAITEKFETNFTLPDYLPYHQTGTVFASALMSQLGQFRITDPVFKGNMDRFINQCVVYPVMIGNKYTLTELQNAPDLWGLVKANASPVLGFLYKEGKTPGKIVTCREGVQKLDALWTAEIKRATALYGSQVQARKITETVFNTSLLGTTRLLAGAISWAGNATDILRQEMMIKAVEDASNNKLSELGSSSNYAATKALLQQRTTYNVAGEIAARTLPLFKNVIEALSYALFIFIVILALLPNGYRILLTYCGILAWTQLWAPLYAVLNLIMTLYGKVETASHGAQNGLTLLNSAAIINANADMVSLAAWLSVSIPFISYGILKQGAGAFVGLAQHLGSAMQSAASGAAAETVSGNISLGNVSLGTQAYQNTTAFQHNTSPSYTASHFKAMGIGGIEQSTFADGTTAFTDQAISRLGVQIMGTENTSFAQQESLNDAISVARAKTKTASEATESSLQQSTNFLSQVGKNISEGKDWTTSLSASDAKSLQDFRNYVEDIRQSTGMTEAQATEAAIGAKLGVEFMGSGISGSSNFSSNAARQKAIDSAKSVATQKGYSENLERIVSAASSFSENHQETNMKELGRGATASLNTAKSLREEASIAESQVKTLSKDLSSSQSKGFTINKELTQDVLTFIAHQPVNKGPDGAGGSSQVGYEGARQILEKGGEERAFYIKRFQEENPQYAIQSINSAQEQTKLTHSYDTEANKLQGGVPLGVQHQHEAQTLMAQGKNAGLAPSQLAPGGEQVKLAASQDGQDSSIFFKEASFSPLQAPSLSQRENHNKHQNTQEQRREESFKGNQAAIINQQKSLPNEHPQQEVLPTPLSLSKTQQEVNAFISGVTKKIEQGQKEAAQKEKKLQETNENAQQQSLTKTAFKNAAERIEKNLPSLPPVDPSTLIFP